MSMAKERLQSLRKVLKPYGLQVVTLRSNHGGIIDKSGRIILTCSASPSDRHAYKNTIKWLIKLGYLPKEARPKN